MEKFVKNKDVLAPADPAIQGYRNTIDEIDAEIIYLLNRRLSIVSDIGRIKEKSGAGVMDKPREIALFQRLLKLNEQGRLNNRDLISIYSRIVAVSRDTQLSIHRKETIDRLPKIYAVFGNRVAHSLSPVMHNTAFSATDHSGAYFAVNTEDIAAAIVGFKALGFSGASVTIPHKVTVMDFLDKVDEQAAEIKAVNTVVNRDGKLVGYNTDCTGAVRALLEKSSIDGKAVAIIGAGGAARAIGHGIRAEGGKLTVFNRSIAAGERLAEDLNAEFCLLPEYERGRFQILINTTPIGMAPHAEESPVSKEALDKEMVVMDIVYNPLKTRFLKDAQAVGAITVDGLSMFVYQGAEQFELWTGKEAPVEIMRMTVLAELQVL